LTLDVEGAQQQPTPHARLRLDFAVARGGWALKRTLAALPPLEVTGFQVHQLPGIACIECQFLRAGAHPDDAPSDEEDIRVAAEFLASAKRCAPSSLLVSVSLEAWNNPEKAEPQVEDEAEPVEGAHALLAELAIDADVILSR